MTKICRENAGFDIDKSVICVYHKIVIIIIFRGKCHVKIQQAKRIHQKISDDAHGSSDGRDDL